VFDVAVIALVSSVVAASGLVTLPWAVAIVALSLSAAAGLCFSESLGTRVRRTALAHRPPAVVARRRKAVAPELKEVARPAEATPSSGRRGVVEGEDDERAFA
jgi:hypothetical protein